MIEKRLLRLNMGLVILNPDYLSIVGESKSDKTIQTEEKSIPSSQTSNQTETSIGQSGGGGDGYDSYDSKTKWDKMLRWIDELSLDRGYGRDGEDIKKVLLNCRLKYPIFLRQANMLPNYIPVPKR